MTAGENIAAGIFKRDGTSEVDTCSDTDTIGVARINNDVSDQPTSGAHVHDSDHAGGSVEAEGGNGEVELIDSGANPFPPASPSSDSWNIFATVLNGFDEDHEMLYWGFVQRKHLHATTMFIITRCVIFPFHLVALLMNGNFFKATCFMLLWVVPFLYCLWLSKKQRLDQLGFGILLMGVGRTLTYSLPMLGLPEFFTSSFGNIIFVPLETLVMPFFEPSPVRLYAPIHHAIWSAGLLRNEFQSDSSHPLAPYLIFLGYCTALGIRVRRDMQDRRAYLMQVNAWHAN